MREELGDQWIEIIDGQKHMVKAVAPIELCKGCLFNCNQGGCCWKGFDNCQMGSFFIIKDLGPVNEDGCLAEERTGLFPTITKVTDGIWKASVYQNGGLMQIEIVVWATTQQQVIYAWNRRT